jgi:hypothetical protein
MSYIGNTSTTQAFTPAVDYFSGNASTTAFTLSRPVASVAQIEAVVNNVVQNPSSAYTVSNNTITFTSAPSSGTNNIYVRYTSPITQVIAPSQGTVGTTQLIDASVTTAKLANLTTLPTSGGNVTIPAVAGTMMVSGNMPAFSAYAQGNQSVSNNTWTKVTLGYEEFDTANCFDSTTNYRFTPNVAGYYQINGMIGGNATGTNPTVVMAAIYKNGATYKRYTTTGNPIDYQSGTISSIVYLNGSTDYVELYGYLRSVTAVISGESSYVITWMNGCLLRAA